MSASGMVISWIDAISSGPVVFLWGIVEWYSAESEGLTWNTSHLQSMVWDWATFV